MPNLENYGVWSDTKNESFSNFCIGLCYQFFFFFFFLRLLAFKIIEALKSIGSRPGMVAHFTHVQGYP